MLLGGIALTIGGVILCVLAWRVERSGTQADERHTNAYLIMRCNGIVFMVGSAVFPLCGAKGWWEGIRTGGTTFLGGLAFFLLAGPFEALQRRHSDDEAVPDDEGDDGGP